MCSDISISPDNASTQTSATAALKMEIKGSVRMSDAYIITKTEYESLHVWKDTENEATKLLHAAIAFAVGLIVQALTVWNTLTNLGLATLIIGFLASVAISVYARNQSQRLSGKAITIKEIIDKETIRVPGE